jgi:ABC-type protease/lipase transport system fused ATPase/permease subunit
VGAADLIARLPHGFDTDVGEGGASLSAGQRRRIAMARALYGRPSLIALDEPEAHLDRDGELALVGALRALKARGAIVLLAAHRPALAAIADRVMILKDGRIAQLGPASEVLQSVAPQPLREVKP